MSIKGFTQGGQVTLHNIRMFRQVFIVTFLVMVVSGVLFWGCKTWFDHAPYQRYVIGSAWWADIKLSISSDKNRPTQIFRYENGQEEILRCLAIQNNKVIQAWVKAFEDQAWYNAWLSLWCMGGTFLLVSGFWIWRGRVKKHKKILSGLKIVTPRVLKKMLKKDTSLFHVGGMPLRKDSETQHLLVCGTTGTGKSTCFFELLPQIRKAGQRAIIVDITGEFVARYYREGKDILINPFDDRTQGWTPWIDCTSPYHYDEVAAAFIPQTGGDKFWSDAACTIFSETLKHHAKQGNYDTDYMLHMLLTVPLRELFLYLGETPAASLVDPAGDRTAMSIRAHLSAYLKPLVFLPKGRLPFSIRAWVQSQEPGSRRQSLPPAKAGKPGKQPGEQTAQAQDQAQDKTQDQKQEPQWVFIMGTPDQRETLRPFLTALTSSAINALMSCTPNRDRRLWFIIDELASLHKQEALPKALAEIRKYGGCIAVGLQDIPQLQAQYGRAEAESLVSLLNTRVIFRNGHPDTARVMSQMLGEQEVREAVEAISYGANSIRDGVSLNDQNKMKPVVTPTQLMSLENREAYLKLPGNLPVTRIKFKIPSPNLICPDFIPISDYKPPEGSVPSALQLDQQVRPREAEVETCVLDALAGERGNDESFKRNLKTVQSKD